MQGGEDEKAVVTAEDLGTEMSYAYDENDVIWRTKYLAVVVADTRQEEEVLQKRSRIIQ